MSFTDQIGTTISQGVSNAINVGTGTGTRNIGLLTERVRGVEDKLTLVTNIRDDQRIFGGHNTSMYSSYCIEDMFNNAGGFPINLYQIRKVGAGSVAASADIINTYPSTQSFVTTTTQNATSSQGQENAIAADNIDVGDTFVVEITDPIAVTVEVEATSTYPSDLYILVAEALNDNTTFSYAGFLATYDTDGVYILSPDDVAFTQTSSTTNNSTINQHIITVTAGRQGQPDKGDWGNDLVVKTYPIGDSQGSPLGYTSKVYLKGYLVETWVSTGTSWQSLIDLVNQNSEYIMMTAVNLTIALTLGVCITTLIDGVYEAPADGDLLPAHNTVTGAPEGLALFEGTPVDIVACLEVFSASYVVAASLWASLNNKFFAFNMPYLATESVLTQYYNALFDANQSYKGGYLNWKKFQPSDNSAPLWIPCLGYVLGAGYIRKCGLFNGATWTPPAGQETFDMSAIEYTHSTLDDRTLSRYAMTWHCNAIKFQPKVGFIIWTSRTYSDNDLYQSIHVMLETMWLITAIPEMNNRFLQQIFTPTGGKTQRNINRIFFKNLYDAGGIEQSLDFDKAVVITVTQNKLKRRETDMEIGWIPPECTEMIKISLNRNDGILILNS